MKIGYKFTKHTPEIVEWCNENNATIVAEEDCFKVVEAEESIYSYAELREFNYNIGLQVGALMKQANYDRLQGKELIQELDDALGHVQSVKTQIPKPKEEVVDDTI